MSKKSKTDVQGRKKATPRSLAIAKRGVSTGSDFASMMSALMSDLIEGRMDPQIGNTRLYWCRLMTVFAVLALADHAAALEPLIQAAFPGNHLTMAPGQFLVATTGAHSSKEIWAQIVGEQKLLGIVFPLSGYFGLAPASIWEWITAKRQAEP